MIGVILARGGSVGLPGKNVAEINGVPLVTRAARTAGVVCERVIVSTDCHQIARAAIAGGAEIVERPAALATSSTISFDALRHAICEAGIDSTLCMIQCTNPFLTTDDIVGTVGAMHDMAVCVAESHELLVDGKGVPINWSCSDQTLRQQRIQQYRLVGSVWAFTPAYVLGGDCYRGDVGIYVTSGPQVDIDTAEDLAIARNLLAGGPD